LDLSIAIPQYKLTLAKATGMPSETVHKLISDDKAVYDIYKKEIELADLILCGSDFVRQSCLSEGIDPVKLVLLPYGIDLGKFSNPHIQPETPKIKVVFIGSVTFRKGADIVLESWKKIKQIFPLAELHFYGSVEMPTPENIADVFYHGFITQEALIQELKQAHISILPSFFEGSSLAIYQSMAMGLAVITTPNSGSIIENNKNGLLINYGSEGELTENLKLLLNDSSLRMQLAVNAAEDVKEYTWDNYGNKLVKVLKNVLGRKG
jgi:glycosyltransferase involved in cell wall biosynthesis